MTFTMREFDGVNQTPAVRLILRAQLELLENGFAARELCVSWDQQAIVASVGPIDVGVLVYSHEKWRKLMWIQLSYTVPDLRRSGVYTAMWERAKKIAQRLGCVEIQGGTHVSNVAMLRAAQSVGRENLSITTRYKVPAARRGKSK